jgi:uncharacterized membrane protein
MDIEIKIKKKPRTFRSLVWKTNPQWQRERVKSRTDLERLMHKRREQIYLSKLH